MVEGYSFFSSRMGNKDHEKEQAVMIEREKEHAEYMHAKKE